MENPEVQQAEKPNFAEICRVAKITPKVAFIGAGNMAKALINGFLRTGLLSHDAISVSCRSETTRNYVEQHLGIRAYTSNTELLNQVDGGIVFLAIKPQQLKKEVLVEILKNWEKSSSKFGLLVSIVAGATLHKIMSKFLDYKRDVLRITTTCNSDTVRMPIARVMPNTPVVIGCGASAFARNNHCTSTHGTVVKTLMETVGICYEVEEGYLDAVTGLAASGPAFIYTIIDALAKGGIQMGLPSALSTALTAQMVMGAAKMVQETGKHPGELTDQVCSPAGTTIAGIRVLENGYVRATFMSAVEAATNRAKALSEEILLDEDKEHQNTIHHNIYN